LWRFFALAEIDLLKQSTQWKRTMKGSILNRAFDCRHKRLTWPITPVKKPGVTGGETYVVCLDCAKQFAYDWDNMRTGEPIERSPDVGVLRPDMPSPAKKRVKYTLIGSAISLALFLGNSLIRNRRASRTSNSKTTDSPPANDSARA
jgi:hypothetical protein